MIVGVPGHHERIGRVGVKVFDNDRRPWGKMKAAAERRLLEQANALGGDRVVDVTYHRTGWFRYRWLRARGTAVRSISTEET